MTITFDGGQTSVNFAQAALVLQGTASVYEVSKKECMSLPQVSIQGLQREINLDFYKSMMMK